MDHMMKTRLTFDELRRANLKRVREVWHHESDWSPERWLSCVVGEVGELASAMKEVWRKKYLPAVEEQAFTQPNPDRSAVADELADIVLYLDLLAARCGLDLAECVTAKFNEKSDEFECNIKLPEPRLTYSDSEDDPDKVGA